MASRQRLWQVQKLRQGLCQSCGKEPVGPKSTIHCARCLDLHNASARRRRAERRIEEKVEKALDKGGSQD